MARKTKKSQRGPVLELLGHDQRLYHASRESLMDAGSKVMEIQARIASEVSEAVAKVLADNREDWMQVVASYNGDVGDLVRAMRQIAWSPDAVGDEREREAFAAAADEVEAAKVDGSELEISLPPIQLDPNPGRRASRHVEVVVSSPRLKSVKVDPERGSVTTAGGDRDAEDIAYSVPVKLGPY